ncbi:MAG TPA: sensor histidine kinase [Solirubrobacteraceae bacterium]|nr:sensor histidine kinase [Solirubrobacteraceae bacterium]
MTTASMRAVVIAALLAGGGVTALILTSDHQDNKAVWAILQPAVGWSFVGTGLYASRRRPDSRTGLLMVAMGFAWFLAALDASNSAVVFTFSLVAGGLFGATFLHLAQSFPTGRLPERFDRRLVIAGYVIFPFAFVPALLFAGQEELDCSDCPDNLLQISHDATMAGILRGVGGALYFGLFVVVLIRAIRRWRASEGLERQQLTPVYVCALAAFLLVTGANASGSDVLGVAAIVASGLLPFAFLGGLLRSHVSHLDAELRESLVELRASRARIVEAADAERRRLERDLHDGAQSRLVALALLLRSARNRADADPALAATLDQAQEELQTSLAELRELARGIHPAVLSQRGLEPALEALATRAPVPVTLDVDVGGRLPSAHETAAYFVVSEALVNVAKYARASHATVAVRRVNGHVSVEVVDDGVGGADPAGGSGLRGLADRVAALDGTLALDSPAGRGTRLQADLPLS